MGNLTESLTTIYNTKLAIKEAIGTQSDVFAEYPALITAAINNSGSGSSVNIEDLNWYGDLPGAQYMIENELTELDFYWGCIYDNFVCEPIEESGEPTGEYTCYWDESINIDGTDYTIRTNITGNPNSINFEDIISVFDDYSEDLYNSVYPVLQNVTMTASSDPSENGYDYLVEGDLYYFNLSDNSAIVEEISENGFYLNSGQLGFNVDVASGSNTDDCFISVTALDYLCYTGETEATNAETQISDNFVFEEILDGNDEPTGEYDCYWDALYNNAGNAFTVRVHITGDPNDFLSQGMNLVQAFDDYPGLYGYVYPRLTNVTITASEDPSNDEYDYLVEGDLYAWNPKDCIDNVYEVTTNGLFIADGQVALDINVSGGGITPSGTSYISTNGTHDVSSYAYAYVNVPNNGVVLSGGEYWHVSPIDADTSINISQSANSYINIVSFNEYNVESEDGMSPGNSFTALTVKDTNGTILEESYGTTAFNEGESVTLTLQSATTICLYKYYWVWNTVPGDPEMGIPDSYYLDVSSSEPISAGTNNGYILENLPAGTYTIIVKWGYQGNNDIVILNHINVSNQCVASSNQYFEI